MPDDDQDNDRDEGGNRRMALVGLGAVVVLFALSWWVAQALYTSSKLQDCLMSGRTNCAVLAAPDK